MAGNSDVKVNFLGDADSLARAAARSRRELDQVNTRAHTISTALGTAVGTIAGRAIGGIASAAASGVRSLADVAAASIDAASAQEESLNKSSVVFGANAKAVEAWARDNKKNILLTVGAAVESAATFGNLFVALGVGQAKAASMSTTLVGLASDLSSFNNVDTGQALDALQSGLLGEARPLRQFGVSLSEARVQAEAFALGIAKPVKSAAAITAANNAVAAAQQNVTKVEKAHGVGTLAAAQARDKLAAAEGRLTKAVGGQKAALTDAQKVQVREAIILKDTTTAQGDAARTSGGYANATRILHKNLSDASAELGTKLLPYATRATVAMSKLITEFENGTGTGGQLRDTLKSAAGTAKAFGDAILPIVKYLATHPNVFATLALGVVAFKVAAAAAAFRAGALGTALFGVAGGEVAVATAAPAAAEGIAAVGAAGAAGITGIGVAALAILGPLAIVAEAVALIVKNLDAVKATAKYLIEHPFATSVPGLKESPAHRTLSYTLTHPFATSVPKDYHNPKAAPYTAHAPQTPDDYDQKAGRGRAAVTAAKTAAETAAGGKVIATATKSAADVTGAAQKYATDQFAANQARDAAAVQAAADKKAAAAAALEAATQKIRDALQARKDMAAGIHDSLVTSNGVLRDGLSYTAKDLLTRFQNKLAKVKQFAAAISAMVHKHYAPSIIQEVASAGVDGLATAKALAGASASQVAEFNATAKGISNAAQYAGDRATKGVLGLAPQLPPQIINLVVDGKTLATTVNNWNAQASGGRPGVRTR